MNNVPHIGGYIQSDVQKLYTDGYIVPNIDVYGNLTIQNTKNQLYSSSITLPFKNEVYLSQKVESIYDVQFSEL